MPSYCHFDLFAGNINYFWFNYQDWSGQSASNIVSEMCGFITILSGTIVLRSTKEPDPPSNAGIHIFAGPTVFF